MTKTFFLRTTIAIAICLLTNMVYSQSETISDFPWAEGFENNDTILPPYWEQEVLSWWGWSWAVVQGTNGTPTTAHGGSYKTQIFLSFDGLPVYYTKLVTPVFDLSTIDNAVLKFWHTQIEPGYLIVHYKKSQNDDWTLLKAFYPWEAGNILDWQESSILLPEKSDQYQIAFEGVFLGGGIADVQLDDISISESDEVSIAKTNASNIKICPNPSNDKFFVEFNGIVSIKLYDILGKEVLTQTVDGKQEINISHLPKGVYNVRFISDDKIVGNNKIIKN